MMTENKEKIPDEEKVEIKDNQKKPEVDEAPEESKIENTSETEETEKENIEAKDTTKEDVEVKDTQKEDIESQDTPIKESKRKIGLWTILAIILGLAIIAFFALYAYNNYIDQDDFNDNQKVINDTYKEYNYFSFEKDGMHWKTTWMNKNQPYILSMRHWPGELLDIPIEGKLNLMFNGSKDIYLTFHPKSENLDYQALAATELSLNINKALGRNIIAACLVNQTADCALRPIVTCDDDDKAVIYLKDSNQSMVTLDGNCMIIEGDGEGLVKATEKILYIWYGIMSR